MERILGLDVGDRRVGVAVSDELGLTAQPVLTLVRKIDVRTSAPWAGWCANTGATRW
jgi:RNase H-fold protein (predicted Holliday junction resolvase)